MTSRIQIGTCGFGRTKKPDYIKQLSAVEIQHVFYKPPQIKTLEKWRAEMPNDFEFTLKAFQMITHEPGTPTYRRLKRDLTEKEENEAGAFKPTDMVREAWETTLACAKALGTRTILFQCPAKFKQTEENIENMRKFFGSIKSKKMNFVWEPRGNTWEPDVIKEICDELGLWHVVDPFKAITTTPDRCYFRLHGIDGWRYKYEEGELEELVSLLPKRKLSYVVFNNREMFEDALRFKKIVQEIRG